MEFRELGGTGITVSRIALGCGNFGGIGSSPAFFGQGESHAEAFALLDAARAMGITLLDTADAYGGGRSERWIGEWLREHGPDRAVVATKVFHSVEGDPRDRGLAPDRIRRQVAGSLARLGLDRIDLYLIHEPDQETPLADTLEALDELVRAGSVRAIGASNVDAELLEEALALSAERGLARFEWVQNSYSLLERAGRREEVLRLCAAHGLGFTPFSPLAGGWLTGKYRRGETPVAGSRMATRPEPYAHLLDDAVYDGLEALESLARERDTDPATLALAWLLADERVTSVIVGPRRPQHLWPAARALDLTLTPAEREELEALFPAL